MSRRSFWSYVPPGPLVSLLLVGLVLLSGLLYYRAVRIQRFLEPALALSQPRNDFSEAIARIVEHEFGKDPVRGITVRTSSIIIDQSLLVSPDGRLHAAGRSVLKRLARAFLELLQDKSTRADISLILISAGYSPRGGSSESAGRDRTQRMLAGLLDALLAEQPVLKTSYRNFITTTARPVPASPNGYPELVEFRIIPSEMLHMEVLQRLQKYAE